MPNYCRRHAKPPPSPLASASSPSRCALGRPASPSRASRPGFPPATAPAPAPVSEPVLPSAPFPTARGRLQHPRWGRKQVGRRWARGRGEGSRRAWLVLRLRILARLRRPASEGRRPVEEALGAGEDLLGCVLVAYAASSLPFFFAEENPSQIRQEMDAAMISCMSSGETGLHVWIKQHHSELLHAHLVFFYLVMSLVSTFNESQLTKYVKILVSSHAPPPEGKLKPVYRRSTPMSSLDVLVYNHWQLFQAMTRIFLLWFCFRI